MTPLFLRLTEGITLPLGNLAFYKTSPTVMEVHSLATNPPLRVATVSGIDLQALETFLDGSMEVQVGPNGTLDLPKALRARNSAQEAFQRQSPVDWSKTDMPQLVLGQDLVEHPIANKIGELFGDNLTKPKSKPGNPKLVDVDVIRKKLQNL